MKQPAVCQVKKKTIYRFVKEVYPTKTAVTAAAKSFRPDLTGLNLSHFNMAKGLPDTMHL